MDNKLKLEKNSYDNLFKALWNLNDYQIPTFIHQEVSKGK